MKKIIKSIIFCIIFFLIFSFVFNKLWLRKNSISYFYDEPKDSIDVAYLGSSNVIMHFNPTLAFHEYGFTTSLLSWHSQAFVSIKYLIEETQKYQNPKLYIIDLTQVYNNDIVFNEGCTRNITDSMKFSLNRIELINNILKYFDKNDRNYINYYFSFLKYHNKWKYIFDGSANRENYTIYKGFVFDEKEDSIKIRSQNKEEWDTKEVELNEVQSDILYDLLNYIKKNDLNVLFIIPPRPNSNENRQKLNSVSKIINSYDYDVINFNKVENLNIDFATDFKDSSHLNVYGATKFTLYFGKYLSEKYNLKNNNPNIYNSWNNEYERFKTDFKNLTKTDFDNLLNEYKKDY